jgi:uroporphyrinogen III methyltransferase / synthase
MNYGKVYIAGAGPGDPELITIKALEILRKAQVVLFDKLANPVLLKEVNDSCELFFVGKEAGRHFVTQDKTIELLIEKAKEGKTVLRLKGGDPLIFGRGSEEALALKNEGISYEIIPGITAGAAAPAYAGIPLTHRKLVTQTVFLTAHESPDKPDTQIDWEHLANMKNTNLVIYMGVSSLPNVVDILIKKGMDPHNFAALIENGTMPYQRTVTGELREMPEIAKQHNIKAPAIFFIGPSVSLRQDLKWFEDKPLFGKRIVTTRAKDQSASLYQKLTKLGANVIPFKVIKTCFSDTRKNLGGYLNKNKFDWIIFSSENGVRYFFEALRQNRLDSRIIANSKIAVIGSGTALKLSSYYLNADFVPSTFTSKNFVEEFTSNEEIKNTNILRVKGDFKSDLITDSLRAAGANVDTFEVYKLLTDKPDENIIRDLKKKGADAFTFTSMSTVNHFFDVLGDIEAKRLLLQSKVISIGPVTSGILKEKGITNVINSSSYTIDGMIETLLKVFRK